MNNRNNLCKTHWEQSHISMENYHNWDNNYDYFSPKFIKWTHLNEPTGEFKLRILNPITKLTVTKTLPLKEVLEPPCGKVPSHGFRPPHTLAPALIPLNIIFQNIDAANTVNWKVGITLPQIDSTMNI